MEIEQRDQGTEGTPEQSAVGEPTTVSGKAVLMVAALVLAAVVALWLAPGRIHKPPPKPPPSVVAETMLLTAAQKAREAGDHGAALRALSEHERRYPDGALAEAREVVRVETLCTLGRSGEAAAVRERFLTRFPDSEHAASVRAGCAGEPLNR